MCNRIREEQKHQETDLKKELPLLEQLFVECLGVLTATKFILPEYGGNKTKIENVEFFYFRGNEIFLKLVELYFF